MVTEQDIINMGRKIKRSKNPKTLTKYQIQRDTWIAELEEAQAQAQADILAINPNRDLSSKIQLEEEAKAHQGARTDIALAAIPKLDESKKVAVKIAEKAGVSPVALPGIATEDEFKEVPLAEIGSSNTPKEVAVKIAGPRKCYHYFEFERSHFRRSRF